jgi:hypothetical protein
MLFVVVSSALIISAIYDETYIVKLKGDDEEEEKS